MARPTKTGYVKKICGCVKFKECAHPWYVEYFKGKEVGPDGKWRKRGLRGKLATFVGREPSDFADAKVEAQRAIVAFEEGRDARGLLPGDAPTLTAVLDAYGQRPDGAPLDRWQRAHLLKTVVNGRAFGDWRAAEITREVIDAFRAQRPKVAGNRDLSLLRAMFNWAVLGGLVPSTPFKIGGVPAIKRSREEPRSRRLYPGEEERLLLAARGLHRDLIIAALESGCRRGELLSLQWHQVRADLFLPGGKTKAKKPRRIPISSVLRAVLDTRRLDPAGAPLLPTAYVFGDEIGRAVQSIKTAWRGICTRAGIDGLHFHDLRREAGSRWLDAGVPLSTIQKWLGHANISQTSTYLQATSGGDADAMERYEQALGRLSQIVPLSNAKGSDSDPVVPEISEIAPKNATIH